MSIVVGDTVGQVVVRRLREAGVQRVYGIPGGGSNLDIIEALGEVGIGWVLAHTETAAGFMACADAELGTGPGVLLVGNGPGLASSVNAVAHASLDRVPLLVISDRYTDGEAATTGHQVLDQRALLAPLVKLSATLDPADAEWSIDRAIELSMAGPRGPVHLDVRRDTARMPVALDVRGGSSAAGVASTGLAQGLHDPDVGGRPSQPGMASAQLGLRLPDPDVRGPSSPAGVGSAEAGLGWPAAAAELVCAAQRPVILVGLEANLAPAIDRQLLELAGAIGAAVLTTYKAKGTYPERDDRWAGILTGGRIESPLLEQADAILAVGLDPVELLGRPWPYRAPVVSLSESHAGDEYLKSHIRSHGPLPVALDELLGSASRQGAGSPGLSVGEIGGLREQALDSLRVDGDELLPSWRVVEAVMDELPAETTVTVDAGAHMFAATMFARPSGPRRFLISNGLASMGFAVPAALAAAMARPGEVAVAFTGDGGTAYNVAELETAARHGVRMIVVVLNDSSLSLIRIKHEANGRTRDSMDFRPVRFDRVARGFGVHGIRVETEAELRAAIAEAAERPSSTLVDVQTTGCEYGRMLATIRGA